MCGNKCKNCKCKEKRFNIDNIEQVKLEIREGLNFPYINLYHPTLGGNETISLLLTVSLDNREAWSNDILANSSYIKLHIHNEGVVELITRSREIKKFRKFIA